MTHNCTATVLQHYADGPSGVTDPRMVRDRMGFRPHQAAFQVRGVKMLMVARLASTLWPHDVASMGRGQVATLLCSLLLAACGCAGLDGPTSAVPPAGLQRTCHAAQAHKQASCDASLPRAETLPASVTTPLECLLIVKP